MVKPIKPEDIVYLKVFPDEVITAFNELIAKKWNGSQAVIKTKDVMALIVSKGISQKTLLDNHYLDVEDLYKTEGWRVKYESPSWEESFDPFYKFTKKQKQ